MTTRLRLLIVEDSEDDAQLLVRHLERAGYALDALCVDTPGDMNAALQAHEWDLVIADCAMPRFSATAALRCVKSLQPGIPFVIVSGAITEEAAAEAMAAGAHDCITKGNLVRLVPVIQRELAESGERRRLHAAENEIKRQEDMFEETFESVPLGIAHTDAKTYRWIRVNQAMCDIFGYSRKELFQRTFLDMRYPGDPPDLDQLEQLLRGEIDRYVLQRRYVRKDGSVIWASLTVTLIKAREGDPTVMAIVKDITGWVESRRELEDSERRFRVLFANNPVPMWVYDPDSLRFLEVNEAAVAQYGYPREEFLKIRLTDIRPPEDVPALLEQISLPRAERHQTQGRHKLRNGDIIEVETSAMPLDFDGQEATLVLAQNITTRKAYEHALTHDRLTGLPNREFLSSQLEAMLSERDATSPLALLLVDMDRFKEINDTFGHHHGDLLLQELGRRLRAVIHTSDLAARLGGDEFAIVLPDTTLDGARSAAQRLLQSLDAPYVLDGQTLDVSASMGGVVFPDHGHDMNCLLQRADIAMYEAKRRRSGFELYDRQRDKNTPERLALIAELRGGIPRDELFIQFQPQAKLATGEIVAAEALVRWNHPGRGLLSPDKFVPLAEHTDLIVPLARWVLHHALSEVRSWLPQHPNFCVSVNVSARNLHVPDLVADIRSALSKWQVPPSALKIELTETGIMDDPELALRTLDQIHNLGVRISIDDFGPGYSSLAYLKRLPVDEIKIDRSFVTDMMDNKNDAFIVRSTIELGHNLGVKVVAEGVEDERTRDLLAVLGCDTIQGYFLGRPMKASDLGRLLDAEVTARPRVCAA